MVALSSSSADRVLPRCQHRWTTPLGIVTPREAQKVACAGGGYAGTAFISNAA
jgi:hypothetical protein